MRIEVRQEQGQPTVVVGPIVGATPENHPLPTIIAALLILVLVVLVAQLRRRRRA